MSREIERVIRRAGGVFLRAGKRHRYYQLGGRCITVSHSHTDNPRQLTEVRMIARRLKREHLP